MKRAVSSNHGVRVAVRESSTGTFLYCSSPSKEFGKLVEMLRTAVTFSACSTSRSHECWQLPSNRCGKTVDGTTSSPRPLSETHGLSELACRQVSTERIWRAGIIGADRGQDTCISSRFPTEGASHNAGNSQRKSWKPPVERMATKVQLVKRNVTR